MRRTLNLCPENGVTVSVVYAKGYRLDILDNAAREELSVTRQMPHRLLPSAGR